MTKEVKNNSKEGGNAVKTFTQKRVNLMFFVGLMVGLVAGIILGAVIV